MDKRRRSESTAGRHPRTAPADEVPPAG